MWYVACGTATLLLALMTMREHQDAYSTGEVATTTGSIGDRIGETTESTTSSRLIHAGYKPNLRVNPSMTKAEREAIMAKLNYTRRIRLEGFECLGYPQSTNSTPEGLVVWDVSDGAMVAYLEDHSFECTGKMWGITELNCDMTVPRTCKDGKPVTPTIDVFNGNAGCSDMIAAMNILHNESTDDEDAACYGDGKRLDSSPDENECSGSGTWRSCPYNAFFSGMIPMIATTSDLRFHQHAHNIQGNAKLWQHCRSSHYMDMIGHPRWRRATYSSNRNTWIDIYEGDSMQKCTEQDNWYVHVKGYALGTFCSTQELRTRAGHTCGPQFRSEGNFCYSSDNSHCLMDFQTIANDTATCDPIQQGPRTTQLTSGWCCGLCQ